MIKYLPNLGRQASYIPTAGIQLGEAFKKEHPGSRRKVYLSQEGTLTFECSLRLRAQIFRRRPPQITEG